MNRLSLGLAIAILLLLVPLAAFASDPLLTACVNSGNGNLRLVDASIDCHANEVRVQWNVTGPAGPPGPAGPAGPAGTSAGGPPYVWVCTPANYFSGSTTSATAFIHNGSASTANVAFHLLNKDGLNLAGAAVPVGPGDPAAIFPGETGATTVALAAGNTRIVKWKTAVGDPDAGGNIPATVTVTSDQPIAVGTNIEFSGFHPLPCSLLPK